MWKMLAYFATGVAVLGLLVAWQNRKEAERLRAELAARPVVEVTRPSGPSPQVPERTAIQRRTDRETTALLDQLERDGYRCIDGQLFEVRPGELRQIGRCPTP